MSDTTINTKTRKNIKKYTFHDTSTPSFTDRNIVNQYSKKEYELTRKAIKELFDNDNKDHTEESVRWYWERKLSLKEILYAKDLYTEAIEHAVNRIKYCQKSIAELDKLQKQIEHKPVKGNRTAEGF